MKNEAITNLFSIDSEKIVLGSLMCDNSTFQIAKASCLNNEDFYFESHRIIYNIIKDLIKNNITAEPNSVAEKLKSSGHLAQIGGVSQLIGFTCLVASESNIAYYINIMKEFTIKRKIEKLINNIDKNMTSIDIKEFITLGEEIKNTVLDTKSVEELYVNAATIKKQGKIESISTGFDIVDKYTTGLPLGTMSIITGKPSCGKSTLINQIVANAISNNYKAFIYSGELKKEYLMTWFVRTVSNENHIARVSNNLGQVYYDVCDVGDNLIRKWTDEKLFIYGDESVADEKNLVNVIEHMAIIKGVKLFVLDNLMTMDFKDDYHKNENKYDKQASMVKQLKYLAKKYGLVIILVAHPNKESERGGTHSMYGVLGASEIVNLCDFVFKLIREKEQVEENEGNDQEEITKLMVLKNRITGKQNGFIKIYFDDFRKRFYTNMKKELKKDFRYSTRGVKYEDRNI